jgi:nucleotide-binding universal stress UspA family protein
MVKTLVVPLDGSERAEEAIAPASWLASRLDAELTLVTSTFAADVSDEEEILARGLRAASTTHATTHLARGAFAARAILDIAADSPDPMICMSTRGRGALATMLLGSVSNAVLSESRYPAALVGPRCSPWSGEGEGAVVCVDQASDPGSWLGAVGAVPLQLGVQIHMVTVHPPNREWTAASPPDAAEWTAEVLRHRGVDAVEHDLADDDVVGSILSLVREVDARFLAIGAHHPSHGGPEAPFGRIGSELVREAPCPIIVQHLTDES